MKHIYLAGLLLLATAGCATSKASKGEADVASDADTNLQRGNEAVVGRNFEDAQKYFEYVRTKYPFLEQAREAELRLADVDYEQELYPEARDRYQTFIKLHPTHAKVDYAAYRAAMTWFKEVPGAVFIFPPPFEKDQAAVQSAEKALSAFVRTYPTSKYAEPAQKTLADVRRQLADHELYVAQFYAKREKWQAVVGRLEGLVKNFPDVGLDDQAYFGLHHAYEKLSQPEKAKDALRALISRQPGTAAAKKAERLLGS